MYQTASFCEVNIPQLPHWGPDPKNTNPHNSGPEVDIDFFLTAFFIVSRVLKCGKVMQVTPPEATDT